MASRAGKPLCNNSLTHKHPPKRSVLLKDYLRDDLSSCSSNGFRSFPRRQCCTTVGFLLEKDRQRQRKRRTIVAQQRSNSYSVLQRASGAIMNAIKWLPLSQKGGKAKKGSGGVLSRSLSRKLLSRSFWRKVVKEEGSECVPRRRRSFRELIMQDREHHHQTVSSLNEDSNMNNINNPAHAPTLSFTTSSGCGSDSWGDSEFTFASTGASSESSNENYLVLECTKDGSTRHKIDEAVTKEYWSNEKEQFSPVSILDCPFEDEEEIYKSDFKSTSTTLSFLEGSKRKHVHKIRQFKSVASLEQHNHSTKQHNHSTKQRSLLLVHKKLTQNNNKNHNKENNARDLLNFVNRSINPPNSLVIKAENLLFDFFKQSIGESKEIDHSKKHQLCKVAEDWIRGQQQEQYLGWEVQRGRGVYVKEMDKCGEWKNSDREMHQLGQELANELLEDLVHEFLLDLTCH